MNYVMGHINELKIGCQNYRVSEFGGIRICYVVRIQNTSVYK